MAIYRISQRGTNTTSGGAVMDMATSTGIRPRLLEAHIFLGAATASLYSLARSTALGTRTTPTVLSPEDPADPVLTGITLVDSAIAWSVAPTISAVDLARIGLPATIGTGVIWTFPRGIVCAVSLSLCLTNRATNSAAADCTVIADA